MHKIAINHDKLRFIAINRTEQHHKINTKRTHHYKKELELINHSRRTADRDGGQTHTDTAETETET